MIYLDHFRVPYGGQRIALDPWIIKGGLSRQEAEVELARKGLSFKEVDASWSEGTHEMIELESGVRLTFVEEEDWSGLYAVSLQRRSA